MRGVKCDCLGRITLQMPAISPIITQEGSFPIESAMLEHRAEYPHIVELANCPGFI